MRSCLLCGGEQNIGILYKQFAITRLCFILKERGAELPSVREMYYHFINSGSYSKVCGKKEVPFLSISKKYFPIFFPKPYILCFKISNKLLNYSCASVFLSYKLEPVCFEHYVLSLPRTHMEKSHGRKSILYLKNLNLLSDLKTALVTQSTTEAVENQPNIIFPDAQKGFPPGQRPTPFIGNTVGNMYKEEAILYM